MKRCVWFPSRSSNPPSKSNQPSQWASSQGCPRNTVARSWGHSAITSRPWWWLVMGWAGQRYQSKHQWYIDIEVYWGIFRYQTSIYSHGLTKEIWISTVRIRWFLTTDLIMRQPLTRTSFVLPPPRIIAKARWHALACHDQNAGRSGWVVASSNIFQVCYVPCLFVSDVVSMVGRWLTNSKSLTLDIVWAARLSSLWKLFHKEKHCSNPGTRMHITWKHFNFCTTSYCITSTTVL